MSAEPVLHASSIDADVVRLDPRRAHRRSMRRCLAVLPIVSALVMPVVGVVVGAVVIRWRHDALGAFMVFAAAISAVWYVAAYVEGR
jgi:hypothetical protein